MVRTTAVYTRLFVLRELSCLDYKAVCKRLKAELIRLSVSCTACPVAVNEVPEYLNAATSISGTHSRKSCLCCEAATCAGRTFVLAALMRRPTATAFNPFQNILHDFEAVAKQSNVVGIGEVRGRYGGAHLHTMDVLQHFWERRSKSVTYTLAAMSIRLTPLYLEHCRLSPFLG